MQIFSEFKITTTKVFLASGARNKARSKAHQKSMKFEGLDVFITTAFLKIFKKWLLQNYLCQK